MQARSRKLSGSIWNVRSCAQGMEGPDENACCVTFAPRTCGEKYIANMWNFYVSDGKERSNFERMTAQLDVIDVTWAGSCPKVEIPEVLAASDVCIFTMKDTPMFRTTFPNRFRLHSSLFAMERPIVKRDLFSEQ